MIGISELRQYALDMMIESYGKLGQDLYVETLKKDIEKKILEALDRQF